MFKFKKITSDEFEVAIFKTALILKTKEAIIEKDYWICATLNFLFNQSKLKNHLIFKGGTSLSKCYNLIERFSEDIDLILDWNVLNLKTSEIFNKRSITAQDKFNKQVKKITYDFLVKNLVIELQDYFNNNFDLAVKVSMEDDKSAIIKIEYPILFNSNYLNSSIRLEIGALADWIPNEEVEIEPDIYKIYPKLFEGNKIKVMSTPPERTFWEKATILHREANRPKDKSLPERYARHYYDLYIISDSKYKDIAFQKSHMLKRIADFKQKFYYNSWVDYNKANLKEIRIVPDEYRFKEIKKDYKIMSEMLYGEIPSFETIMKGLKKLEKEIHELG